MSGRGYLLNSGSRALCRHGDSAEALRWLSMAVAKTPGRLAGRCGSRIIAERPPVAPSCRPIVLLEIFAA